MAFRLKRDESVARGLRRLVRKQLRAACDELEGARPRDEGIHEARKSVKKVRAIVHLIKADGGRRLADAKKRLRRVNRTLSKLRDADAMIETLGKLRRAAPRLFSEHTYARIRHQLFAKKQAVKRAAIRAASLKKAADALDEIRDRARRWSPAHRRFGALAPGLKITHRRGRNAMARARSRRGATDFHEWRKAIKTLWYELRLIEECSPSIRRDIRALDRAETSLGEEHNIVVLCDQLSKDATVCRSPAELQRLQRVAARHQDRLRRKALSSARRIYAGGAGAYVRRVKRAWTAAPDGFRQPRTSGRAPSPSSPALRRSPSRRG